MTDVVFGRLSDLPLQDAWAHEAHEFTPWLAKNVEQPDAIMQAAKSVLSVASG